MSSGLDPEKIKNRDSWLRVVVIMFFSLIIGWKILMSPITLNLLEIKLNDIVSLILSIFAIGLSVAFYFKATDTSNLFYDNTYKFTKEISEILGRIEAGFGERLRHLDEGYTGLRDRVEKFPGFDAEKAAKKVKEEEEEIKKKEQERNQLLEDLAKRAKLQESEKSKLFIELKRKDEELLDAKRQLQFLERRITRADSRKYPPEAKRIDKEHSITLSPRILDFMRLRLIDELGRDTVIDSPSEIINRRFNVLKEELPPSIIEEMIDARILDSKGLLTKEGIMFLRELGGKYNIAG